MDYLWDMQWYYIDAQRAAGERRVGPVDEATLRNLIDTQALPPDSLVWNEDLPDWAPWNRLLISHLPLTQNPPAEPSANTDTPEPTPNPAPEYRVLPEQTILPGAPAGFWVRGAALLVDGVILQVLGWGLRSLLSPWVPMGTETEPAIEFLLINLTLLILYNTWFVALYAGTPGKILLQLRIVNADGSPLTAHKALQRYLLTIFSGLTLGIGYLMAISDPEKRTLHDRMAQTRVIRVD